MRYPCRAWTKLARLRSVFIGFLIAALTACAAPATPSPALTPRPPSALITNTPTDTPTSMPGIPILNLPEDGARLPQPVLPNHWDFSWSGRTGPCYGVIEIEGPNNRHISARVDFGNAQDAPYKYTYTQDQYIPDDALTPWYWEAGIYCPLGSSSSAKRTFSVMPRP